MQIINVVALLLMAFILIDGVWVLLFFLDESSLQAFLAVVIVGAALLLILAVWSVWRIRAERRLGYTTLERRFRHLYQLDAKTGAVIRQPGEAFPEKIS
ncbi:hypothetical protein [Lysinibacter sp. HNR]|uniref:hypothetical protein n=1 Tax=Lysinibacter sp. HNR TaxID=3031408 RepID=UPI0024357A71|nr:hypothetical protein [Lysinibacter sp. HNR]WGD37434.1 hypothetical protein FrondiHNR_00490 [Lysinibacter sp. HNR]